MFLNDYETPIGLLYCDAIAQTVVKQVLESTPKPIAIGVPGDWGAAKSSLLAMAEKRFVGHGKILCLRFTGRPRSL
jgi:putative protein kinase ArgK-like GTPase of G3E family